MRYTVLEFAQISPPGFWLIDNSIEEWPAFLGGSLHYPCWLIGTTRAPALQRDYWLASWMRMSPEIGLFEANTLEEIKERYGKKYPPVLSLEPL